MKSDQTAASLAAGTALPEHSAGKRSGASLYQIVVAASLGSCFEAYDLFLVGTMAAVIAKQFFSGVNPALSLIFTLLGFAAGFLVRPLGAMVFGGIGDRLGRKRVFVATVALMGLATVLIGLLPTYATVGVLAPVMFVGLRLVQGFALGGENGGAMVYVAEHVPANRRAFYTSWLQIAPIAGLILSQLVVQRTRSTFGEAAFLGWAWRVPFVLSLVLLALSLWMRTRMGESPEFERLRNERQVSRAPLREAFTGRRNIVAMICSLFALGPGAAVTFYSAFFYTPFFLTEVLRVEPATANLLSMFSLVMAVPIFLAFGVLSDKIERKTVICTGFILVVLCYPAIYRGLTHFANPALERAIETAPVVVVADPHECSTQFNALGTSKFHTSCDLAKSALVRAGISYTNEIASAGAGAIIRVGDKVVASYDGSGPDAPVKAKAFAASLRGALDSAGYPQKAPPHGVNRPMVFLLLVALATFAAMTYAPLAAAMTELFPARIRFTALSVSYHIGFGWTGGFLPAAAFAIVAANGNMYAGLAYPRVAALIGAILVVAFMLAARTGRLNHET
ncbi:MULTISPECIES: MFS transporter [Paraburkholderia]|uniref:MFS transporter n=1 Tax=Paraburkholderia TaxID=1822464 RepID=UPI00037D4179|nr:MULTISPECIES: MFS transporter [Paraburkholderia]MDH6146417.1 MFS family permease [Paraburkholderia sp. WSM4179]